VRREATRFVVAATSRRAVVSSDEMVKDKVNFSRTRYRALGLELIPVYRLSAAGDFMPSTRPLLSARPAVTFPAKERHRQ